MMSYIDLHPERRKLSKQPSVHKGEKKGYGDIRCLRSDPGTHLGIFFNPCRSIIAPWPQVSFSGLMSPKCHSKVVLCPEHFYYASPSSKCWLFLVSFVYFLKWFVVSVWFYFFFFFIYCSEQFITRPLN